LTFDTQKQAVVARISANQVHGVLTITELGYVRLTRAIHQITADAENRCDLSSSRSASVM